LYSQTIVYRLKDHRQRMMTLAFLAPWQIELQITIHVTHSAKGPINETFGNIWAHFTDCPII